MMIMTFKVSVKKSRGVRILRIKMEKGFKYLNVTSFDKALFKAARTLDLPIN